MEGGSAGGVGAADTGGGVAGGMDFFEAVVGDLGVNLGGGKQLVA